VRARSPETRIRYLRQVLKHARWSLTSVVRPEMRPPSYTDADVRAHASCVLKLVEDELMPPRRLRRKG
jgi:hypothetical protein